jgi:hypothetical protein
LALSITLLFGACCGLPREALAHPVAMGDGGLRSSLTLPPLKNVEAPAPRDDVRDETRDAAGNMASSPSVDAPGPIPAGSTLSAAVPDLPDPLCVGRVAEQRISLPVVFLEGLLRPPQR